MAVDNHQNPMFKLAITLSLITICVGSSACARSGSSTPSPLPAADLAALDVGSLQVVAEGMVVPGQYVNLTFPFPGIVEEVLVSEGDQVSSGDLLARLKGRERIEAQVAAAELGLTSAQQVLEDIYDNAPLRKAQAELAMAQAQKAYDDALESREEMKFPVGNGNRIDMAYADYLLSQNRVDDAEKAFEGVAHLPLDDEERAKKLSALQSAREQRDRALLIYNYLKSDHDPLLVGVSEGELQVAKAGLDRAKTDWQLLSDGIDDDELALAQAQLQSATSRLNAARRSLKDLELRAPFAGIVVTNRLKAGELAAPPFSFLSIADYSSWKVETSDLTELDIAAISPGIPASVSIDALPGAGFQGEVESVQSIGISRQNDITYKITIGLEDGDDRLRWNMTAFVIFEVE